MIPPLFIDRALFFSSCSAIGGISKIFRPSKHAKSSYSRISEL
jgi:hypothetical protein